MFKPRYVTTTLAAMAAALVMSAWPPLVSRGGRQSVDVLSVNPTMLVAANLEEGVPANLEGEDGKSDGER